MICIDARRAKAVLKMQINWSELGIVAAQGREGLKELLAIVADANDGKPPVEASLMVLAARLQARQTLINTLEKRIRAQYKSNERSRRLETIPGIGVIGATAIDATLTDPKAFRSGRDFAAWIGLVLRPDSTGGKQKLGRISKQGINTCDASWSWVRTLSCGRRDNIPTSINKVLFQT